MCINCVEKTLLENGKSRRLAIEVLCKKGLTFYNDFYIEMDLNKTPLPSKFVRYELQLAIPYGTES